jgi:hypothetical protein
VDARAPPAAGGDGGAWVRDVAARRRSAGFCFTGAVFKPIFL